MMQSRRQDSNVVVIEARGRVGGFLAELVGRRELLGFLIWRDIKVRYKQTALGVVWALLVPLLQTFLFTAIFGRFAKIQTDGNYSYTVFVLAGLIPWTFFSQALTLGGQSLINQQHLLTKVYFPRLFVPAAAVGGCLLDFFIGFILYAAVLTYYQVLLPRSFWFFPFLVLLTIIATLGIVFLVAALTVRYRDFKYVIPFAVQALMYASPVIYPVTLVPHRYRWILALNPMSGIIDGFRSSILGKPWDPQLIWLSVVSSLVFFVAGVGYFRSTERSFADIA
jgi:lipopolysaccharide transport system permease protein